MQVPPSYILYFFADLCYVHIHQINQNLKLRVLRTNNEGLSLSLQVLKETLTRHGFTFESETDTEVIPKLAKFVFDKAREGITFMLQDIEIFFLS